MKRKRRFSAAAKQRAVDRMRRGESDPARAIGGDDPHIGGPCCDSRVTAGTLSVAELGPCYGLPAPTPPAFGVAVNRPH